MKKSLGWSTAVLGVVLLFSAVSLSAQTETLTSQAQGRLAANIIAVPSALSSGVLAIRSHAIYLMDDDHDSRRDGDRNDWNTNDKDWNKYGDGDGDKDDHHHKYHHEATPEPSTLLSFGAAILIGGGVLYSRRLRKSK